MKFKKVLILIVLFVLTFFYVNAQELTQKVKGKVIDKDTHNPLPGATVVVINTDPLIATITDEEGHFSLENVPLGRQALEIRFVGYETFQINELMISSSKEVNLEIKISEMVTQLDEAVVKAYTQKDKPMNSMALLSARTFSVEEASRYAGGFDDPARLASSFAGITTGSLQDNSIVIRGNAPKGILWQLESVPIPNPNHFAGAISAGGGFVTIFSNQLMANSDFYTGAFPAEYGNALAGVFDMKFRNGNNEKHEHWFQAGVLGLDIGSEGPFVKGKRASYLFNYRYSTYGLLKPIMPEGAGLPVYQDLSFKLNFPTKKAGVFSLWGIGAIDEIIKHENKDSVEWESIQDAEREKTNMLPAAFGLSHKIVLGAKTYLNTTIAATNYSGGHERKRLDEHLDLYDIQSIDVNEQKVIAHSFLNHKFGNRHTNRTGILYSGIFYNIDLKESEQAGEPMQTFVNDNGANFLWQAYTQSKFNLSSKLSSTIGLHAQYFGLNENISIEPRIGFQWNLHPNHSISMGISKHSQLEDLKLYLAQRNGNQPNKNLDFSKAYHLVLGYDWKINDLIRAKVEPYVQYLYDVPVVPDSSYSLINFHQQWFLNDSLVNEGTGLNMGIDLTLERFLNNGFYWLATASIFDSKYTGGDDIERKSAYDRGFVANLLFGKEFYLNKKAGKQRVLSLNGKLTFMGGERLHPILETASLESKDIVYDYQKAFERKANPNFLASLTVQYRKNKAKYSSIWALQILNIFGSPTSNYDFYNYKEKKIDVFTTNVIVPSLYYRIEF